MLFEAVSTSSSLVARAEISKADKPQPQFRDHQYFHSHSSTWFAATLPTCFANAPRHLIMRHNLMRQLIVIFQYLAITFQYTIQTVSNMENSIKHQVQLSLISMLVASGPSVSQCTFSAKKKEETLQTKGNSSNRQIWWLIYCPFFAGSGSCSRMLYQFATATNIKAQFQPPSLFAECGGIDL